MSSRNKLPILYDMTSREGERNALDALRAWGERVERWHRVQIAGLENPDGVDGAWPGSKGYVRVSQVKKGIQVVRESR